MTRLDLRLHANGFICRRGDVDLCQVPDQTKSWHPIPHSMLIDQVQDLMVESGLHIAQEVHALSHDGDRYFGLMEIEAEDDSDYSLVIGLINSNDKSLAARILVGAGVHITNGLSFSGEVVLGRKHTPNIERDLPGIVAQALGKLSDLRTIQDERIAAYKKLQMPNIQAHDLLIKAMDAGVINGGRLPKVLERWRNPDAECLKGDWTAWRLFNAFTDALRDKNLFVLPERTQKLHGLLDAVSGVLVPGKASDESDEETEASRTSAVA